MKLITRNIEKIYSCKNIINTLISILLTAQLFRCALANCKIIVSYGKLELPNTKTKLFKSRSILKIEFLKPKSKVQNSKLLNK